MKTIKGAEVILIETEAFYKLQEEQREAITEAVKEGIFQALENVNPSSDWIRKEPAMALLGVRSKTYLQKLRDAGKIAFTKAKNGRLILYSRKSIMKYLDRNKHDTF